jgi:hypothetical protein
MEADASRAQPVTDRIKDELMRIAFSNPGRIARWSAGGIVLVNSVDLTEDDRAAVKRITLGPSLGQGKKRAQLFEMHDKLSALELLARINGMLPQGKAAPRATVKANESRTRRDANAILRERLLKIAQQGPSTTLRSAQDEASTSLRSAQDEDSTTLRSAQEEQK